MKRIRFSIIIPLYNKGQWIKKTIESILCQDYDDYEIVVVDDGSTDNSADVVRKLNSSKIILLSKANGGPGSARNYGVKHSHGEWVVFLDADDYFEPDALRAFSQLIDKHSSCKVFCCNHYLEKNGRKLLYSTKYKNGFLINNFFSWNIGRCMPRAGAACFRRGIVIQHSYNENLRRYEDAESLFGIMRENRIYRSPIPVMTYSLSNVSASSPCSNIDADFIGHLNLKGKGMWEQYALAQLYKEGLYYYPDDMKRLYKRSDIRTAKVKIATAIIKVLSKFGI